MSERPQDRVSFKDAREGERSSSPSRRIRSFTEHWAKQAERQEKEAQGILPEQSISDAGIWQLREYGVEEIQNEGKYSSALRKQELIPDTPAIDPHLIFSSDGTAMGVNIASTSNPKADVAVNSSDEEHLAKSAKLQRNDTAPSRRTDVLSSRKKGKSHVTTDKHQEPVEHTQKSDNPSSEDHVVTGDDLYLLADYVIDCKEDNTKFNSRDFLRSIDAPSTKTVALIADEDIQKCLDYANLQTKDTRVASTLNNMKVSSRAKVRDDFAKMPPKKKEAINKRKREAKRKKK